LGLPLFVKGVVQPSDRIEIWTTEMRLAGIGVTVLLASPRECSASDHVQEVVKSLGRVMSIRAASREMANGKRL
ncbi:MAG TPA: hypothetical protein VFQ61_36935, partial [Polyangiaceae bacterium]|nr:hypothetical protein [Polyangiaceae bacterium]